MSKSFDSINRTVIELPPIPRGELSRRAVRSILRRINNPELADDVRALARLELKHWRLEIMRLGKHSTTN